MREVITVGDVRFSVGTHRGKSMYVVDLTEGEQAKDPVIRYLLEQGQWALETHGSGDDKLARLIQQVQGYPNNGVGIFLLPQAQADSVRVIEEGYAHGGVVTNQMMAEASRRLHNHNMVGLVAETVATDGISLLETWVNTPFACDGMQTDVPAVQKYAEQVRAIDRFQAKIAEYAGK